MMSGIGRSIWPRTDRRTSISSRNCAICSVAVLTILDELKVDLAKGYLNDGSLPISVASRTPVNQRIHECVQTLDRIDSKNISGAKIFHQPTTGLEGLGVAHKPFPVGRCFSLSIPSPAAQKMSGLFSCGWVHPEQLSCCSSPFPLDLSGP